MNCCSSVILQVIATCVSSSLLGLLSAIAVGSDQLLDIGCVNRAAPQFTTRSVGNRPQPAHIHARGDTLANPFGSPNRSPSITAKRQQQNLFLSLRLIESTRQGTVNTVRHEQNRTRCRLSS